jgi:hypothetical protein
VGGPGGSSMACSPPRVTASPPSRDAQLSPPDPDATSAAAAIGVSARAGAGAGAGEPDGVQRAPSGYDAAVQRMMAGWAMYGVPGNPGTYLNTGGE